MVTSLVRDIDVKLLASKLSSKARLFTSVFIPYPVSPFHVRTYMYYVL